MREIFSFAIEFCLKMCYNTNNEKNAVKLKGAFMDENYNVPLSRVIEKFKLETIHLPDLPENIMITSARVNRPGLQMVGFYDHYEQARLQIIGKVENLFLAQLPDEERYRRVEDFFRSSPIGVIVTTSIEIMP